MILSLESALPACWAAEKDELGAAFKNLQKFARAAERPVPAVAPEPERSVSEKVLSEHRAKLRATPPAKGTRETLDLREPVVIVDPTTFTADILGAERREFTHLIAEIMHGADWREVDTYLTITNLGSFHAVYPPGKRRAIEISTGTLARVQNLDEFAAILIRLVATREPEVFAHRDDPRIMRRLEEQIGFGSLPEDARRAIKADLSTIERLRGMNLRPWGLTDFDRRESSRHAESDKLFEMRLLAQKIAVTYMQERENIRDLIKRPNEFTPGLRAVRDRALRANIPLYARRLLERHSRKAWVVAGLAAAGPLAYFTDFGYAPAAQLATFLRSVGEAPLVSAVHGLVSSLISALGDLLVAVAGAISHVVISAGALLWSIVTGVVGVVAHLAVATYDLVSFILQSVWSWTAVPLYDWILRPFARLVYDVASSLVYFVYELFGLLLSPIAWFWSSAWDHALTIGAVYLAAFLIGGAVVTHRRLREGLMTFARVLREAAGGLGDGFLLLGGEFSKMGTAVKGGAQVFGGAFGRVGVGEVNRWRLRHALERRLSAAHPTLDQATIMRLAAADLHYINEQLKSYSFLSSAAVDPKKLNVLGDFYQVPRDFWSLLDQYLNLLEDQIRTREFGPPDLAGIFRALAPESVPEFFHNADFRSAGRRELVFILFDSDHHRPRLASIYRAAREAFASDSIPFTALNAESGPWPSFDDTAVRGSTFLGLARVAFEMEIAARAPSADQIVGLTKILFDRLHRWDLLPDFLGRTYPVVAQKIFGGEWSRSDAASIHAMYNRLRLERLDESESASTFDRWPSLPGELARTRERALLKDQIGLAAAVATWEATSPFYAAFYQVTAQIAHRSTKGFHRLTRDYTTLRLARKLGSLGSFHEVSAYVEREILDRGARPEVLVPFLYDFAVNHPDLIKSRADVRALLDHDFYWPTAPLPVSGFTAMTDFLRGGLKNLALDKAMAEAMRARQMSRSWRYHASLCGRLHRVMIQRLEQLGERPADYQNLLEFWREMTERGVTAETDRLMQELITLSSPRDLEVLRNFAVKDQRVWEEDLHSRLSIADAKSNEAYQNLIATPVGHPGRAALVDSVVTSLQTSLPERGLAYAKFLEDLSVRINSTFEEAQTLSLAKADVGDRTVSDGNLNEVREIFHKICKWPSADQFNFLKVLRNDENAGRRVLAAFPNVGVERIQRMYEILPLGARVGVLDTFLTHGLLREGPVANDWVKILSEHIVGGHRTEAQRVTLQVLGAFLFAIEKVGNRQMITTILSYLYALPNTQTASPVEVLKLVLEIFGATGIKVGQFTYASQILGESGQILRSLQSRARVPDRIEIYEDVYDLLGVPVGTPLPFLVLELLGAASMKYAFMGQDRENLQRTVVKVFRLDAMNNVDLQFDVLEHMGDYLVEHHGPRYGIFKIIIKSARLAVKREGSMRNEIRRSRIARHRIYRDRSTGEVDVEAPREDLVNRRMIIAQFAAGVTFEDLPVEAKPLFARTLLELEDDIIYADARVIRFDPDRHAGNAQMLFETDPDGEVTVKRRHQLGPIDFGQVLRLPRVQRDRITKLFALAQMAARPEVRPWTLGRMGELLALSTAQREALARHLPLHLAASPGTPVTLYVATLAALEASGFSIDDTTYIDFVRGIIQLTPFESWAPGARAPSRTFEARVIAQIREYLGEFEFEPRTLRAIKFINAFRTWRGRILGGEVRLIPTDLSDVSFDEMIQRERAVTCQENLSAAG